jgi:hypothetical protein
MCYTSLSIAHPLITFHTVWRMNHSLYVHTSPKSSVNLGFSYMIRYGRFIADVRQGLCIISSRYALAKVSLAGRWKHLSYLLYSLPKFHSFMWDRQSFIWWGSHRVFIQLLEAEVKAPVPDLDKGIQINEKREDSTSMSGAMWSFPNLPIFALNTSGVIAHAALARTV